MSLIPSLFGENPSGIITSQIVKSTVTGRRRLSQPFAETTDAKYVVPFINSSEGLYAVPLVNASYQITFGVPTIFADKSAMVGAGTLVPQNSSPISTKVGAGSDITLKLPISAFAPDIPQVLLGEVRLVI